MKTTKHAPQQQLEAVRPGTAGTSAIPIDIQPYAPGMLIMTIPVGLLLPEAHAVKLLAQIHDALAQLRELTAGPNGKTGQGVKRGIAAAKRKR